jgi:hypothetical protein
MTTLKISTGLYTIGNPRKKTKLKSKLSRALDKNKKKYARSNWNPRKQPRIY